MTIQNEAAVAARLARIMDSMMAPGEEDPTKPSRIIMRSGASFAIQGPGVADLRALTREFAADTHGAGPSFETVESWVLDVLVEHEGSPQAAAVALLQRMEALHLRDWQFAIPMPHVILPEGLEELVVGDCRLRRGLPAELPIPERDRPHVGDEFERTVAVVGIEAVDQRSAWRVCMQRLAIVEAIVGAASGGDLRSRPAVALHAEDGEPFGVGRARPDPPLTPWPAIDSDHADGPRWRPGWAELAAATTSDDRIDWEERSLRAVRWFDLMRRRWDAGEAIVAGFAALEALTLRASGRGDKNRRVARRTTELAHLPDFDSPEDQRAWMQRLYGESRTNAVHHGRGVDRDLDAERLTEIVGHLVRYWATRHLAPAHRRDGRPCKTIEETAMSELHL